jgi:phosphopantetheine--protein transferase-like protein
MNDVSESSLENRLARITHDLWGPGLPGIGVDVEHHSRWRSGDPRLTTLFTHAELARAHGMADVPAQLAGTWCAKEAAVKAMASHLTLSLRDVEVVRDALGRPGIRVLPSGLRQHGDRVRVSISRTRDLSVAVAVYLPVGSCEGTES